MKIQIGAITEGRKPPADLKDTAAAIDAYLAYRRDHPVQYPCVIKALIEEGRE